MKNVILLLSVCALLLVSGCKKDKEPTEQQLPVTEDVVAAVVMDGTWHVSCFTYAGTNKTANLKDYTFAFAPQHTLTISKTGTPTFITPWDANTGNDGVKLVMEFDPNKQYFSEISEDWDVVSLTATTVNIQFLNKAKTLTLSKN